MYLNGIMFVSSILNFITAQFDEGNDLPYILFLPSRIPHQPGIIINFQDDLQGGFGKSQFKKRERLLWAITRKP
jgi:hypothetical protein